MIFLKTIYIDKLKKLSLKTYKKLAKRLYKLNKKEKIVVVLSKNLKVEEELISMIEEYAVQILNGRWLFKFLLYPLCFLYICNCLYHS